MLIRHYYLSGVGVQARPINYRGQKHACAMCAMCAIVSRTHPITAGGARIADIGADSPRQIATIVSAGRIIIIVYD